MSELLDAAILSEWELFMTLLHGTNEVNITDGEEGRTPLIYAVIDGELGAVKALIEKGAILDLQCNRGFTALHAASQFYHVSIAKLLLMNNAEVDFQDINGNTPLSVAFFFSQEEGEK